MGYRFPVIAATLLLGGCTKGVSAAARPQLRADGDYRFSERINQSNQLFEGTVSVRGDTVLVTAEPGPCRYDTEPRDGGGPFVYRCADLRVFVDRLDPVSGATYQGNVIVPGQRTACARYETSPTGQRTCVEQRTEPFDRSVTVRGKLHLTPVE